LIASAALTAVFLLGLYGEWFPLGVVGEWTWSRLPKGIGVTPEAVALGVAALLGFAGFSVAGFWVVDRGRPWHRAVWVAGLVPLAVGVGLMLQSAAPAGFGLAKWVFAQHAPGSSGYYTVARSAEMDDWVGFVRRYADWVAGRDVLHIGTHPPGLFVLWRVVLEAYRVGPAAARMVVQIQPEEVRAALRTLGARDPIPLADQAALVSVGWLVLLAAAATGPLVYALARRLDRPRREAWTAAALWPVVPSVLLFQPTSDVAFVLPATAALVCAARGRVVGGFAAGAVLALGMQFSLVFLGVGLVVGLMLAMQSGRSWGERLRAILATGLGFLVLTGLISVVSGASPWAIWWANQRNHARFYVEYPRSWGVWQFANAAEVAVGIGVPLCPWIVLGLWRRPPCRGVLATVAVLAVLQLSGRSLSEVARLWIPFFPGLLLAAAAGLAWTGAGAISLGGLILLQGVQVLALQGAIQVVYSLAEAESGAWHRPVAWPVSGAGGRPSGSDCPGLDAGGRMAGLLDSAKDLVWGVGLGHDQAGPGAEALVAAVIQVTGRDDDHGNPLPLGRGLQPPTQFNPGFVGQHQIEEDQIGRLLADQANGRGGVGGNLGGEAAQGHDASQQVCGLGFVVDDQRGRHL
jgi:hypothetical protein